MEKPNSEIHSFWGNKSGFWVYNPNTLAMNDRPDKSQDANPFRPLAATQRKENAGSFADHRKQKVMQMRWHNVANQSEQVQKAAFSFLWVTSKGLKGFASCDLSG
ncbi:MAG: hypothetical protein AAFQ98_06945, partial [Bacteroidota bacterium]